MHSVIMTSGRSHSGGTARIFVPLTRDAFQRSASAPRRRSASASARTRVFSGSAGTSGTGASQASSRPSVPGTSRADASAATRISAALSGAGVGAADGHFYPDLEYVGYVSAICFLLCGVVLLFTGLIMTVTITIDVDVVGRSESVCNRLG